MLFRAMMMFATRDVILTRDDADASARAFCACDAMAFYAANMSMPAVLMPMTRQSFKPNASRRRL